MKPLSENLIQRYKLASQNAKHSILRHPQLNIREELNMLSESIREDDARDNYGVGGTVSEFEKQLCHLFEKPNCVFLPTGTLAQCVAMKCYSQTSGKDSVCLHPTSHLLLHEHMAVEELWGLKALRVGKEQNVIAIDDIACVNPTDIAAVIIELPMREIGGALPNWDELTAIRAWCDKHSIKMHMDGARVWQVTHYYQRSLAEIACLFDSLYISFYKDLSGTIGAALLGESSFIDSARVWARRAGGNPITQHIDAIAARCGLHEFLDRMPEYVKYTQELTDVLKDAGLNVIPTAPSCSIFHLNFNISPESLAQKIVSYAEINAVIPLPLPRSGTENNCTCEISIGENALKHDIDYWVRHISNCLTQ